MTALSSEPGANKQLHFHQKLHPEWTMISILLSKPISEKYMCHDLILLSLMYLSNHKH